MNKDDLIRELRTINANATAIAGASLGAMIAAINKDRREFDRAMLSLGAAGLRMANAMEAIPNVGALAPLFATEHDTGGHAPPVYTFNPDAELDGSKVIPLDRPGDATNETRHARTAGPYRYQPRELTHEAGCDCGHCSGVRFDKTV